MSKSDETRIALLEQSTITTMELFKSYAKENKEQHEELKELVADIGKKLDTTIEKKADKEEVNELKETVGDLRDWKIKLVAIISLIMFILTFLKDPIIKSLGF